MNIFQKYMGYTAILIIVLGMFVSPAKAENSETILVDAVMAAGAKPDMMDIVDWSVINREFMDFSKMEEKIDGILKMFDAKEKFFETTKENSEMYRIIYTKGKLNSKTSLGIIMQSVLFPDEYEKDPQTYLVVSISGQDFEKYADYKHKVEKSIASMNGQSKITSCVTGTFDSKLNKEERAKILANIYDCLKSSYTRSVKDEYNFSVLGFSPLLTESIEILDKNYNFQVTMRYNSEEDKTFLWIGTPVVCTEY